MISIVAVGSTTGMGPHRYAAVRAAIIGSTSDTECVVSMWTAVDLAARGESWTALRVLWRQQDIDASLRAERASATWVSDAFVRPCKSLCLPSRFFQSAIGAASVNTVRDTRRCRPSRNGPHVAVTASGSEHRRRSAPFGRPGSSWRDRCSNRVSRMPLIDGSRRYREIAPARHGLGLDRRIRPKSIAAEGRRIPQASPFASPTAFTAGGKGSCLCSRV
ncbi:hypothetical protein ACVWWN_003540 [Mycobacterium sp. URHB0021]